MSSRDEASASHTLRGDGIAATVTAQGAELCSLKNAAGIELLWQAGPQWPRHAPVLFPIVGRLNDDELHQSGKTYAMTQHGFARDRLFQWVERGPASCRLVLADDAETRTHYPFAFRLAITYAMGNAELEVMIEIANTGEVILPASFGAHPAFNWPLLPDLDKQAYSLVFSDAEAAPVRRLQGGLMKAAGEPTPIVGNRLALSERLFDDDAVVLDRLASTSVRYAADRGPSIEVSWEGFRELGIWSKPSGAPFLCIEPWHGFASPVDFDGQFSDKPGLMQIARGETRTLRYRIRVG